MDLSFLTLSAISCDVSMAPLPKSTHAERQLVELLQEQQEPFLLDVYLLEHGCSRRILCSEATTMCWWPRNACKRLQRLTRHGFQRRRNGIIRSLLSLFVHRRTRNASNWNKEVLVEGGYSDVRRMAGSTESDQLSCSDEEGDLGKIKFDAERDQEWECTEAAKQLSPVSVLEPHLVDGSPAHSRITEGDPSASVLSLPTEVVDIFEDRHGSAAVPKSITTKWEWEFRGTKQLLWTCAEVEDEHIRCHGSEQTNQQPHEILCSQPRTRLIGCRQVFTWGTLAAGDAATPSLLMESDVSESRREWTHFHPDAREIAAQIGGGIFNDLVQDFVSHMAGLLPR